VALDNYLHRQAGQDLRKRAAVPFVLTNDGTTIAGYYTLSQFSVDLDAVPDDAAKSCRNIPLFRQLCWGGLRLHRPFMGKGWEKCS